MRKPTCFLAFALVFAIGWFVCRNRGGSLPDKDFARFVASKRTQTQELAGRSNGVPSTIWNFFDAVERNDWRGATNLYGRMADSLWLDRGPPRPPAGMMQEIRRTFNLDASLETALRSELWSSITETIGAYRVFHEWDAKWLRRLSHDIIESIPPGSIYFGGTDFGWCAVSAFTTSQREGRPFFIVTQNRLRDEQYLQYLRGMYNQLQTPTPTEVVAAIRDTLENERPTEVMSLEWTVMRILIARNPTREVYVEEFYSVPGMYPYAEPHGLIMKLQREPLSQISDAALTRDREYWNNYVAELVGDWLREETSVKEICDFAEKVYRRGDFAGFKGDANYVRSRETQKGLSKLRSSIAGLYAWREQHAKSPDEQSRMMNAAEYASRQAFMLCPSSPDALFGYVNTLLAQKKIDDARLATETCWHLNPKDAGVIDLRDRLRQFK